MEKYFLLIFLGLFVGCRSSKPPSIEICLGDGMGGADCVERDGSKLYRVPSQLQNYWMTNEPDEQAFASWCYQTSAPAVKVGMDDIKERATGRAAARP